MKNLSVIIDWLEFTMLHTDLTQAMKILDLDWDSFSPLAKGRYGYNHQLKWNDGNVFIMFTAKDDAADINTLIDLKAGVHVIISGQGCRQYSVNHDLLDLIHRLHKQDRINFSRIDLAIDDFESEIVSYDKINKTAKQGFFTSRWSKWDEICSRQTSDNKYLGRTMYFGSQASDLFCRVYDKTLERKAKSDAESDIPQRWTRLEVVYRKDRASKLAEYIVKGIPIGHALRGTLKQYLRFLTKTNDSNKARWPSAPWWDRLLSDVDKLQLTIKKEARTIDDMTEWIDQQISPTLSAIMKAQGGDLAWLRSILVKGSKRLSQKHKDAINQYMKGMTA